MTDEAAKKKSRLLGCVLAICVMAFVAIPITGILAAIAIPAFLRYIKSSKSAEAESTVSRTADAIRTYYTANCKFPADGPPTTTTVPAGGAKVVSTYAGGWKEIGMTFSDGSPQYFRYQFSADNGGMKVWAEADFNPSGGLNHILEQRIDPMPDGKCETTLGVPVVLNEWE